MVPTPTKQTLDTDGNALRRLGGIFLAGLYAGVEGDQEKVALAVLLGAGLRVLVVFVGIFAQGRNMRHDGGHDEHADQDQGADHGESVRDAGRAAQGKDQADGGRGEAQGHDERLSVGHPAGGIVHVGLYVAHCEVAQECADDDDRHPSRHGPDRPAEGLYKHAHGLGESIVRQKRNEEHDDHDLDEHFAHQRVRAAEGGIDLKNWRTDLEEGQLVFPGGFPELLLENGKVDQQRGAEYADLKIVVSLQPGGEEIVDIVNGKDGASSEREFDKENADADKGTDQKPGNRGRAGNDFRVVHYVLPSLEPV